MLSTDLWTCSAHVGALGANPAVPQHPLESTRPVLFNFHNESETNQRLTFFFQGNGDGRPANTGENIAWNLGLATSPARESVLRWYLEIFDYNRANPTVGAGGRPVGKLLYFFIVIYFS